MKPYFAKYLPVEGEIRKEDKWQHPNGAIFPWTESYANGPIKALKSKKVKLFLCSRDIQVGDQAIAEIRKDYTFTGKVEKSLGKGLFEINHVPCYPFKIIGEISPDATWVKEGDEFERNEFEMRWTNSKGENALCMFDVIQTEEDVVLKAYVKGPCGHFH